MRLLLLLMALLLSCGGYDRYLVESEYGYVTSRPDRLLREMGWRLETNTPEFVATEWHMFTLETSSSLYAHEVQLRIEVDIEAQKVDGLCIQRRVRTWGTKPLPWKFGKCTNPTALWNIRAAVAALRPGA